MSPVDPRKSSTFLPCDSSLHSVLEPSLLFLIHLMPASSAQTPRLKSHVFGLRHMSHLTGSSRLHLVLQIYFFEICFLFLIPVATVLCILMGPPVCLWVSWEHIEVKDKWYIHSSIHSLINFTKNWDRSHSYWEKQGWSFWENWTWPGNLIVFSHPI